MDWEKVAKFLEEEKEEAEGQVLKHLQLIVVLLRGADGNNKVDPVLWEEAL